MVYLLLLPFLGLIAWGVVRKVMGWAHSDEFGENLAISLGITFLFVPLILFPCWTMANGAGLAKWKAFQQANTTNYEVAIDETASYLSVEEFEDQLIAGSVEKWEQAGFVSERIAEWRDAVNGYNLQIASMQYYNQNPFTGVLVPNGVEDMKLLIIR